MHTGDLAEMREDGYCNIVGRIKDMVIRGGENIYPREIEEFLYTHPDIEDVQVIGVPDEKYGEELCAWVKMRAGADAAGRRRGPRVRDRQAGALQDPALRAGRRRVPDDGHRQDPQGRRCARRPRRSSASGEAQAPLRSVRHPEAFASDPHQDLDDARPPVPARQPRSSTASTPGPAEPGPGGARPDGRDGRRAAGRPRRRRDAGPAGSRPRS